MRVSNDTLLSNGSVSLATDWTSEAIPLQYLNTYSIQLVFTGSLAGSFTLECSDAEDLSSATWTEIDGSLQVIAEPGDHVWSVSEASYRHVRVKWDYIAGAGVLTFARFNAKGI